MRIEPKRQSPAQLEVDVAIIGGGPGGSSTGAFLKKYSPDLRVAVFEREKFPREHVGESQLPPISQVLFEMGCWNKVEAAGFPIKIGATYRWGNSEKLWDFEFIPVDSYVEEQRPRAYRGLARSLALQVDRAVYDEILLSHARELGVEVYEETPVVSVRKSEDRVEVLELSGGREVRARHYVDASGNAAVLRRAMGVEVDVPTKLRNVAFWDYWENAEWASRFPGGATRVLVLSIGAGWIWFIPLSPTRTSIGFVCPADYHKQSGRSPEAAYLWAIEQEPTIEELTRNATREGKVRATKDWSFLANRLYGENWMLVGETAGFADPILAAGLTLAQTGAREAAYTILELERGEHEPEWLKKWYADYQSQRIRQHIRFADLWYSANGIFTDLQEYTRDIARDAGLDLDARNAFQWLGTGGFTFDVPGQVGLGGLDVAGVRQITQRFVEMDAKWDLSKYNVFRLDLDGAETVDMPLYQGGRISKVKCHIRENKRLPVQGLFKLVLDVLPGSPDAGAFTRTLQKLLPMKFGSEAPLMLHHCLQVLEVMVNDGWVIGRLDPNKPRLTLESPREGSIIHTNRDLNERIEKSGR